MRLTCTLVILCLLIEIAMFTTISSDVSGNVVRYSAWEKDDVPRVKIKVFRGPTQEGNGEFFATWGYWIQQPSR